MNTVRTLVMATLAFALATPAMAAPHRVTVINATGGTMLRLFASPSEGRPVDEDVLGDTVLKPGQSASLQIGNGGEACQYDLKATFDSGGTKTRSKVDICTVQTYRFTG